jgi:NUMOD1 domain
LKPGFTPLRKINQLLATGHITTVINRKDGYTKVYDSIRSVAKDLGTNHVTLLNYMNNDKLLKGIYSVTRKFK